MPRTDTTALPYLLVNLPAGRAKFTFPSPESSNRTLITIPPGSAWTTTLHWHETHTEYIRVLQGRLRVTVGKTTKEVGPEDGDLRIEKFVVHEFRRADGGTVDGRGSGGDVEVMEWTDPCNICPSSLSFEDPQHQIIDCPNLADGFTEVFFRNIMSIIHDANEEIGISTALQLVTSIAWLDNYVVIFPGPAGWYVTHAVYGIGKTIGRLLGYKPWYEEYTPVRVRTIAAKGGRVEVQKRE